ncbi:MAG: NUDIX hydrolase [Candidatus Marinimicrobia bacterium]|jgi:8-oxo-dGTP pyrophosphatase MutT (NUDIX family)|nr:NUDIX hydrolase [Candidatus Neomarinimicrobiota bacterium]MBT4035289.1 NUDIX hydrolase [Candidatus Neomarinimicrobiota bacterium]MBT4716056.1 NUDIX hydrolase [Candidatus Neomarinimicrobiota bacterium]MBT5269734.1 NUDIX hydrolase [Candidatus Neomarinimicrobiota bacterium]MBT6010913.1 NUDIX hydrolase [Candidatus Neomarinimicrobiota bacterium]
MSSKIKLKYFKQSGVIPVYKGKVVVITARGSKRWIIPKGSIDWELSAQESAGKEALEEAGIKGEVLPDEIGTYTYEKLGGSYKVRLYYMEVTKLKEKWDEKHFRKRKLLTPKQAIKKVVPAAVSKIMASFFHENRHIIKKKKRKSRKKKKG